MNIRMHSGRRRAGITLLEVMVLLAAMALLAFILLPRLVGLTSAGQKAKRISCTGHLKHIGLSYRTWAYDHGDKFPMSLAMTNGGTMDHPLAHEPWVHYQRLSNELNTPVVLVCPTDRRMKEATSFAVGFGKSNVSYFVSLDAEERFPQMILSGDRNLASNGVAVARGLYTLNVAATNTWTKAMHNQCGNLGLADGSVQQASSTRLQQIVQESPRTNRLAIP